jgi:hypothetical protein
MSRSRANRTTQLGVEVLQARVVPAVVVTQLDIDADGGSDDLVIVGDAGKNFVTIQDNGVDTLTVSVDANGDGDLADAGDLNGVNFTYSGRVAILAKLGAAKDTFSYELTSPIASRTKDIVVNLGAGNDAATFVTGAINDSVLGGSQLDVEVYGGIGHDAVNFTTGQVNGSVVGLRVDLGAGNDKGSVTFANIDNGSSVDVDAILGDGANAFTLDLQGVGFNQHADVSANVVGGIDADAVNVNLHDDVGGGAVPGRSTLAVSAELGAGNDKFTASLDYAGSTFRVDDQSLASIRVRGGAGDDTLVTQGVGAAGTIHVDPFALLDIAMLGGAGNDTVSVNLGKTDALWLEGGIKVRADGGAGNDALSVLLANNAATTGNYDVVVNAGAGNDTVTFALDNNGGTPTFTPKMIILDGGLGLDVLTDGNKPVTAETFFETVV